VTCGGDKTIRKWDANECKMILGTKPFSDDISAIDWSPNGKYIVVADDLAKVHLLDSDNLKILDVFQTSF
jgi:WD40 repeat protein